MRVLRHADGRAFLDAAQPYLLRAEAENNLILWIADAHAGGPANPLYAATVHADAEVIGVAVRVPPRKLVISRLPAEAVEPLVRDVDEAYGPLPAVLGPEPVVEQFAEHWSRRTGQSSRAGTRQRIYELERVIQPPDPPPGRLRPARDADLSLLTSWIAAFHAEAVPSERFNSAEVAAARLRGGMLFVWEDGEPVSMAAWSGRTPNGVRVNLVYTPPALRARGYASACVSALTTRLLQQGNRFCFLFTDLANPTSNRIYQRMGYRPVCDVTDYVFAPAGS